MQTQTGPSIQVWCSGNSSNVLNVFWMCSNPNCWNRIIIIFHFIARLMLLLHWNQSIDIVQWWLHTVDRPVTSDMWHVTWASSVLTCTDHRFAATDQSLFTNSHSKILLNIVPSPFKSVLEAVFSKLARKMLTTVPYWCIAIVTYCQCLNLQLNGSRAFKKSPLIMRTWTHAFFHVVLSNWPGEMHLMCRSLLMSQPLVCTQSLSGSNLTLIKDI